MTKIVVAYYSKTGNTEKVANLISDGAKSIPGTVVETVKADDLNIKEAVKADGFAFGSPSYFSMMSGSLLTLLTELYLSREELAGKPMVAFATGIGGQTKTTENIEGILKAFNPKLIQPSLAIGKDFSDSDKQQTRKLGENLAKVAAEEKALKS